LSKVSIKLIPKLVSNQLFGTGERKRRLEGEKAEALRERKRRPEGEKAEAL
jgi:hypothetical protein